MSSFVPPGYVSTMDALTEIYEEQFPEQKVPNADVWLAVLNSKTRSGLQSKQKSLEDRLVSVVNQLLGDLYEGHRSAFYVTRYDQHKIENHRFALNGAGLMLVKGEIPWSVKGTALGEQPRIFLSHKVTQAEFEEDYAGNHEGSVETAVGRPNKGENAALVYWGMFPRGHAIEGLDWANALHRVNSQLKRLRLPEVKNTTFRNYVNEMKPSDD